jgi:hypothetical protein
MKIFLHKVNVLCVVFFFISFFITNELAAQNIGDYRSNATNGNWTTLSSWQYYDGTDWVTPSGTSPQGYPGQFVGTGAVLIQSGDKIIIDSAITTLSFGTLTISGTLTLTGDNSSGGLDFYLITQSIVVTPSFGFIEFNNKLNLRLPASSSVEVSEGSLDVASGCSANQIIYIGSAAYSKCNGGGNLPDFTDLMNSGGTLKAIITAVSSMCKDSYVSLNGSYSGIAGKTVSGGITSGVNYTWEITSPTGIVTSSVAQNFGFTGDLVGNYTVKLTCSTYFGTDLFTSYQTNIITVNDLPVMPTISSSGSTTFCNGGNVTLTSSIGSSYLWSTGETTRSINVSNSGSYSVQIKNASGCQSASSAVTDVTVNSVPTIIGTTPSSICGSGTVTLGATASSGIINWYATSTGGSSLGTGTSFVTPLISSTATYYVDAINSGCTTAVRTAVVATVNPLPIITSQPTNQLDCEGSIVTFKVVASGTGLSYTWQRKKPTDVSFITIPSGETNTTYPSSTGEIRLESVGSAQYPDGTQFQVIISNGTCSVISNVVTLSVNEITNLTGGTNVTQCYGTNYNYTVSTSYPANVVSYQWKKSVTSGIWDVISDGGVYSGATTETLTITGGTPAESAEYRVYITFHSSGADCNVGSYSRNRKITFLPELLIPETTVVHPTCDTNTGTISVSVQSATDTYSFDNGDSFQSSNVKSGLGAGSYNIVIKNIGNCESNIKTTVIDAQPTIPSAPIIGTITQPNCTLDTGSVELSGLPSTGTWILIRSGISSATTTGTGTSTTITGLVDGGDYTFMVSNGTCISTASSVVHIDAISTMTSTWNGSSWVNDVPDASKRIVFTGDFSSTDDVTGCSCKVSSGANVVINSAHTLTVTNHVDVQTNGSLTFENNASLVQINDAAVNTGNINYKRYTAPVRRYDFTYWSSPVVGQTLKNLSPNTLGDKYYGYIPGTGWVIYYNGAKVMEPGNGYLARAPQTFSITDPAIDTAPVFIGVPNNGVVSLTLEANLSYLLGNPYPCALNADAFLTENASKLEGTLYFWTHNSPPSSAVAGNATYNYTVNDYATYNLTGGVGTGVASYTEGVVPTGMIAAGQGFFAPASPDGGTVVFNNSMRISGGISGLNNSQFFKLSNFSKSSATVAPIDKNRIWLNLTNKEGAFKQTLIGYITGATNDYDRGFDGLTYDGNQYIDFYSVNREENLTIQGRALPFEKDDNVALGYKSTIKGDFQISIDHMDGILASQNVFLEDTTLQLLHDLKKEPYIFSTEKGTFNTRFVLRYVNKSDIIDDTNTSVINVIISNSNNEIKINTVNEIIDDVYLYDLSGNLIYENTDIASNEIVIKNLIISNYSVFIVKVVLESGEIVSKKIIY